MIENAKRRNWDGFLASVDEKSVWAAHWYVSSDPMDGGRA